MSFFTNPSQQMTDSTFYLTPRKRKALMHICIVSLSKEIARAMKISDRTRRMDLMIDTNIKKLSHLELIYTCIADLGFTKYSREEGVDCARFRNNVETLLSSLWRNYRTDRLPRGKLFFGSKVGALDFQKLFTYLKGRGNYAQNPVIDCLLLV